MIQQIATGVRLNEELYYSIKSSLSLKLFQKKILLILRKVNNFLLMMKHTTTNNMLKQHEEELYL